MARGARHPAGLAEGVEVKVKSKTRTKAKPTPEAVGHYHPRLGLLEAGKIYEVDEADLRTGAFEPVAREEKAALRAKPKEKSK